MAEPIVVRFTVSFSDYYAAYLVHNRVGFRSALYSFVNIASVFIIVAALAGIILSHGNKVPAGILLITLGLVGIMRMQLMKWYFHSIYIKTPGKDAVVEYRFTPDGVSVTSELGSSELVWSALHKVVQSEKYILLYQQPNLFHYLPVASFQDAKNVERFTQMVDSHEIPYVVIR